MACSIKSPCGGILRDDHAFNRAAAAEGSRTRRRHCLNQHSFLRQAPPGRPRKGKEVTIRCRGCGRTVTRYATASTLPTTCGPRCRAKVGGLTRAKRHALPKPVRAEIDRRYGAGEPVKAITADLGVCLTSVYRNVHSRRTRLTRCMAPRCTEAPWKRVVNARGYLTGRRCRKHQREFWRAKARRLAEARRAA